MTKVYLSPSLQEQNIGVGAFGTEMTRAYEVANLVARYLNAAGISTKLPPKNWSALAGDDLLWKVVKDSNDFRADAHVCLHTNAASDRAADGTLVLHCPGSHGGLRLAGLIYKRLAPISPGTDYGLATQPVFYETTHAKAPVAYVEAAFHTNPAEAKDYVFARKLYAWAIAAGILEYFGKPIPVKPVGSTTYIKVPLPLRKPVWWKYLEKYLARVKATG